MDYNKEDIFVFNDDYLKKYFDMKLSNVSYTIKKSILNYPIDDCPFFIFTDQPMYQKKENEYCILMTNDKATIQNLNSHLISKKFIGNLYYTNKVLPSIAIDERFIKLVKHQLAKTNIQNVNLHILLLLSFLLFFEEKHFFCYSEIMNNWNISHDEKKFIHFLIKKKKLIVY